MPRKYKRAIIEAKRIEAKHGKPVAFKITGSAAKPTAFAAETGEGESKKLPSFKGNAYTGVPMNPSGYWTPIICDLAGIKISQQHRPVLRQHDHEQIVGHTNSVTVKADGKDKGIWIDGVCSGQPEHVEKVTVLAKNGFQWQLSIGANPTRTEFLESGEEAEVNEMKVTGPLIIARETDIEEISFVPLGADGNTSATVTASGGKKMSRYHAALKNIQAGKYSNEEVDAMDETEAKAALKECMAEDEPDGDEKPKAKAEDKEPDGDEPAKAKAAARARIQAAREEEANEISRISAIKAAIRKHNADTVTIKANGLNVNLAEHAIRAGWNPEKAELEALRASRPAEGVGQSPLFYSKSNPQINDAVLECAVFQSMGGQFQLFDKGFYAEDPDRPGHRRVNASMERRITQEISSRYTDQVQQAAHDHFKSRIGYQQLLTLAASNYGYRGRDTITSQDDWGNVARYLAHGSSRLEADGASTVSITNVISNVQNKFMLQGYLFTEQAWQEICPVKPVKDFKAMKSTAIFGDSEFKEVGPNGELEHATLSDQAFANQAGLVGRMITLPMQHIVNDDLGQLGQVPMVLGRGWGLKVNKLVWTAFMNPGYDDGGSTNFYAAIHTIAGASANSNYSTGAGSTLSHAGLTAAEILFNNQVDPAGNPLGVDPEILVYPPDLQVAATELMRSQTIIMSALGSTSSASKQPATNIWYNRFKPVMSRYLNKSSFTGYSSAYWYMLANPAVLPVVELAAWNGSVIPTVQTAGQDWNFNMLGISMRGFGGVGVTKQNFRGGIKSAGA